jgi:serine/threonine protein kinase
MVDAAGQPKIIDFGVARATAPDQALTAELTDAPALIGTLPYMSPEQCAEGKSDLDTRSDVYSLGVVLYELLCGTLPYDVATSPMHMAPQIIREQPPIRPSAIVRTLRGDLETIILKALEKDRDRRYDSAAALATFPLIPQLNGAYLQGGTTRITTGLLEDLLPPEEVPEIVIAHIDRDFSLAALYFYNLSRPERPFHTLWNDGHIYDLHWNEEKGILVFIAYSNALVANVPELEGFAQLHAIGPGAPWVMVAIRPASFSGTQSVLFPLKHGEKRGRSMAGQRGRGACAVEKTKPATPSGASPRHRER